VAKHDLRDEERDYHREGERALHPAPRLFPGRLWQDPAIRAAVLCAIMGGLIVWCLVTGLPYLITHINLSFSWH
jgi:hypothetical protein